ncbi:hypothetical protein BDV93DRAFT_519488 [Ceratobasidium sp. AG-I]|nr:hypothetical protein BDV93DRAFT_519488 [Ceratobasidium sp. AG-I]
MGETTFACDPCRRRKRKCDRRTPICSLCEKRNDKCVYDPTLDQRRPAQRDYVAALEARVTLLEGVLRDAGARDVASPSGLASIDEGDSTQAMHAAIAPPPIAFAQPEPTAPEFEPEFVPSDEAAQALVPITHPSPRGISATTPDELDLGMGDYLPLVSLDHEHKLLAQFWDWQRMHMPFVAPAPMLAAYALHAQTAHPGEPIPPPPAPPPPDVYPGPSTSAIGVPRPESVRADPELVQFISPLLLDAMFAVAALFHGYANLSNQFYKRAEERVIGEAANPRLATVQGVMLMAMAELGHARAPAAWTLNGVAVALCVRLGMHVDATPLVRCETMSKTLFETRNFVFWANYNTDRFYATCMGLHPLMDRRIISTPRHTSVAAVHLSPSVKPEPHTPVAGSPTSPTDKPTVFEVGITWWSPQTLGMGDVITQVAWEAIRDLIRIMDMLFDGIYAFNAPKRTPQEDLELVARNNLTIQRFLDELPTMLRSTSTIRKKETGLVYVHIFVHLASILTSRPFLSPRPLSDDAMRMDAATDESQPTHSSHIIRRYRTLAFRVARASALQITSLIRYIPLSSPCVTLPYVVYSACTILLLAPDDPAAMDGVRTGLACLESMDETGYWVSSAKDGRERVQALAKRWGVNIGQGRKVLGPVVKGRGGRGGSSGPGTGEGDDADPGLSSDAGSSAPWGGTSKFSGSPSGSRSASEFGSENWSASVTQSSPAAEMHYVKAEPGADHGHGHSDPMRQYGDPRGQMYADPEYSEGIATTSNQGYPTLLPQQGYGAATSDTHYARITQNHAGQERSRNPYPDTNRLTVPTYAPQQQSHTSAQSVWSKTQANGARNDYFSQTNSGATDFKIQVQLREGSSSAPQQSYWQQQAQHQQPRQSLNEQQLRTQYAPQLQYQPQQPDSHPSIQHHVHIHQHYLAPPPSDTLPHVAYALSHAEPQHDSRIPHTHWHQLPSPGGSDIACSPHSTCTDLAACFADTVQTAQEPAFVQSMEDPYADVAVDWVSDMGCSFPAMTMETYTGSGGARSGMGMDPIKTGMSAAGLSSGGWGPAMYTQGGEAGRSYGHGPPGYGYGGAGSVRV